MAAANQAVASAPSLLPKVRDMRTLGDGLPCEEKGRSVRSRRPGHAHDSVGLNTRLLARMSSPSGRRRLRPGGRADLPFVPPARAFLLQTQRESAAPDQFPISVTSLGLLKTKSCSCVPQVLRGQRCSFTDQRGVTARVALGRGEPARPCRTAHGEPQMPRLGRERSS